MGMVLSETRGHARAAIVADHDDFLVAQQLNELFDVLGHVALVVASCRLIACSCTENYDM